MSLFRRTPAPAGAPHCFTRLLILAACILAISAPLSAAERSRIQVNDYVIDADLAPKTHHITARAKVKFTALDDISTAVFELNNALRVTRVTSEAGKVMPTERVTQDLESRRQLRHRIHELIQLSQSSSITTSEMRQHLLLGVAQFGKRFARQLVRSLHRDDQHYSSGILFRDRQRVEACAASSRVVGQ